MKKQNWNFLIAIVFLVAALVLVEARAAELKVIFQGQEKVFKTEELLKHPALTKVKIFRDASYLQKEVEYQAVPLVELFKGLSLAEDAVIQSKALDGYAVPLTWRRLRMDSPAESKAYLAIEPLNEKWGPLKAGKKSGPGPFYLVWVSPELSQISPEEWPFQLASFEVKDSLQISYPLVFPKKKGVQEGELTKGAQVFVTRCFACHTMNKQGVSAMGPDLNLPYNPTEYMKESFLKKLIRNPQDLRHWSQSKMAGFKQEQLSEAELKALLVYLKQMAKEKASL